MSNDIVRIALANFTDWPKFEQLATEIMRDEGYPDIKPLGGQKDGGKDAVVEKTYSHIGKRTRTVFQFSLRKDVLDKIKETIQRLNESGTKYEKLVLVTIANYGTERQEATKKEVRKTHDLELEIYDNKTLMTHLSNFKNGMFYRIFPDVHKQVEALLTSEMERRYYDAQARELELLKVCCAFSLNPVARKTRKSLIDQTVLALMWMEHGKELTGESVLARANEILGRGVLADVGQVNAAIGRLKDDNLIEPINSGYQINTDGKLFIECAQTEIESTAEAAIGDIIADVVQTHGEASSDFERTQLGVNTRNVLIEYFRLNGLELANSILSGGVPILIYGQAIDRLKEMASRQLPSYLGLILFDAIGRALMNPTVEQAKYFANCSRAYLAFQVMNIDPALREFQSTRIAKKIFVLDTDYVIDAIIQDLPKSKIYRQLISQLNAIGAKILVPREVLLEVSTHFMISVRTYDYFEEYLNSISEELLNVQVQNALVKGYWHHAREKGCHKNGFLKYQRNYYDEGEGEKFVAEVVREALPGVIIEPIADALKVEVDQERVDSVQSVMLDLSQASGKGLHRTEDQNRQLANTDTLLMLSVAKFNESSGTGSGLILQNKGYIITASGRYIRAAQRLSLDIRVSTRPYILVGLIEMFSPSGLSDRQFVVLFENPIVHLAICKSWSDVAILLAAGVELRGISLTRLNHDVETKLHEQISAISAAEDEDAKTDRQIELVAEAEKLGYQPNEVVATLMARDMTAQDKIKSLEEQNEALREAVKRFGKRKERWLKRFDQTTRK